MSVLHKFGNPDHDNDHAGNLKAFSQLSRSHYGKHTLLYRPNEVDRFTIGMYSPCGRASGEFFIHFENIGGNIVARLECYSDAVSAMQCMPKLLSGLAQIGSLLTVENLYLLLIELGYKDQTKVEPSND